MALGEWLRNWLARRTTSTAYVMLEAAYSYLVQKNFDEARRLLLKALKHQDETSDPAFTAYILEALMTTWLFQDKHKEAIDFFSDYLQRRPNDAKAFQGRGAAFWYSGKLREAIADFSKVLEISPTDGSAFSSRGQVLVECGEYDQAVKDLSHALQILFDNPDLDPVNKTSLMAYAHNGRAAAFAGLGDFDRASKEFEESIAICPNNAWVYFNRAQAHDRRGDREGAIADYQQALAKGEPPLNLLKKEQAEKRLADLSARSA